MKRIIACLAIGISAATFVACSSDSSSTTTTPSSRSVAGCPPSGSTCTAADEKSYSDCLTTKCDAQYSECLGAGYKSGSFGGACGAMMQCSNACACGDTACASKCVPDAACQSCLLNKVSPCTEQCPRPACYGGGTPSSVKCDELKTCCAAIADATKKGTCETQYNSGKAAGDAFCGPVLDQYKSAGDCK